MDPYKYESLIISPNNNTSNVNYIISVIPPVAQQYVKSQVCLASLAIYYSWFNISTAFKNFNVSYQFDGVTTNIVIPSGYYSPADIGAYINFIQEGLGQFTLNSDGSNQYYINISENPTYYADTISLTPIVLPAGGSNPNSIVLSGFDPQVIIPPLSQSNFGLLLGFTGQSIPPTATETLPYAINSNFTPEVNPVTAVNITCNIVNNFNFSGIQGYMTTFNQGDTLFGNQINYVPSFPLWFDILEATTFNQVLISFYDDVGHPLGINDTNIVATLYFRTVREN